MVAMNSGKPFYQSKTFWWNLASGVAVVFWGDVKPYVSPEIAGTVVVVGNMLLRFITSEPISLK